MSSGDTFLNNHRVGVASASGIYTYMSGSASNSGTVIDTAGWTGVVFVIQYHSACATACCVFKVQGAATSASCVAGTTVDLSGTGIITAVAGSGQLLVTEVHKPLQRYIRLYAFRDTSGSQFSATYLLYGPTGFASNPVPIANANAGALGITDASAGIVIVEQVVSPAVGTA